MDFFSSGAEGHASFPFDPSTPGSGAERPGPRCPLPSDPNDLCLIAEAIRLKDWVDRTRPLLFHGNNGNRASNRADHERFEDARERARNAIEEGFDGRFDDQTAIDERSDEQRAIDGWTDEIPDWEDVVWGHYWECLEPSEHPELVVVVAHIRTFRSNGRWCA